MNRRAWLLAPVIALVSLGLGLIVLWLLLPLVSPGSGSPGSHVDPLRLEAGDFDSSPVVAWFADVGGDFGQVDGARSRSALHAEVSLEAEHYPQIALELRDLSPNARVYLFWRSANSPGAASSMALADVKEGENWYSLAGQEDWRGSISAIALVAVAGPRPPLLRVAAVAFHGGTRQALVERSWSQWTRFDPWKMGSVNRYAGARGDVIVYPAVAFAAWSAIALLVFLGAARLLRLPRPVIAAVALSLLFLPWIGLDRIWQSQLDAQFEVTRDRFGGLTQAEKHQREMDSEIQRYAARLASSLPSAPENRIFLLHDSTGHNYWRLRLQFHLLPRNIYNFGRELLSGMRPGDHVLVLGDVEGVGYDAARGLLSDGERAWRAQLVDRHRHGRVYRLDERVKPAPGGEGG